MLPQEIIRRKRDGASLSASEISAAAKGLTDGSFNDAQAAAFAMAVFFRGMSLEETTALTHAMRDSGTVLDWSAAGLENEAIVDKHSTGGIGDKVSLMLAPMVAACGGYVPMISGRGLGHTGGTLDKFDSIPGYRTAPARDLFMRVVRTAGCAVIGPTDDLAPADRRLYAVRDVTATVESLPLITASILSKKFAAGVRGLVLDVKHGSGAFMSDQEQARRLAESLTAVAASAGLPAVALLTDMNEALGTSIGNAVEMREAVDYLTGIDREPRLHAVTLALASEMLVLGGLAPTVRDAEALVLSRLEDGSAAERFAKMVAELGGPTTLLERPEAVLPKAPLAVEVLAQRAGVVAAIDARALGTAVVEMGGGRTAPGQGIDHAVGITDMIRLGQAVEAGDRLCRLHVRDAASQACAEASVRTALTLSAPGTPVVVAPPIAARIKA